MTHWMCSDCEYLYEADAPAGSCPECSSECDSYNVTCYIPECGGPGHLDERLVLDVKRGLKKEKPFL